jgi:hypothetical protein
MTATQYSTIETAITAKLATITQIKNVYNYRKGDLSGYPSCCLIGFTGNSEPTSANTAKRTMVFTFQIFQEADKNSIGASAAEAVLNTIIDKLWNAFDTDWMLSCNVDNVFISRIIKTSIMAENYMRVLEFDLNCEKLYTLNT